MDGCPLGLGLVVEDKPTEFSCEDDSSGVYLASIVEFRGAIIVCYEKDQVSTNISGGKKMTSVPLTHPSPNKYSFHLYTNLDSFSKLLSGTLFPEDDIFPAAAAEEPVVL